MATPDAIAHVLASTLNADPNVRISAELSLSELLKSPQSTLSLAQLVFSQDVESSLRQMSLGSATRAKDHSAIIILRKYVKEHWSPFFPHFRGDAPPVELKDQIRRAVFQGLSDSDRKIRSLCAHTLSTIANSDWPDEYPDLLNLLVQLLLSGSSSSVHGAMQVLTEFVRTDLTEDQLLPVMRELLPVLMSILSANEQHSPLTRSRTISVFRQCVEALYMVKDQHPQAAKVAAENVLPAWLDAFNVLLNLDPQQDISAEHWDGLGIRIQIFRTLETVHTSFPRVLTPYLPAYVTAALHHLHALYPTFVAYYLTDGLAVPNSSEGEPIELYRLITPLVDFVTGATRQSKARVAFDEGTLGKWVDALVQWAQMTKENEEQWAADANMFISQEEDDTQVYSVRIAVFDLLSSLLTNAPVQTVSALHTSVLRIVTEANKAREGGVEDWWRPLEGAFAVLGSQAEVILDISNDEHDAGRPRPIDIEYLLAHVIPSLLTLSAYPFLQGRCLFLASRFAELLPADVRGQYFQAAIQVIESNETEIPFKVSAVKSIQHFAEYISDAELAMVPRIIRDLGPFLLETSEDTLSLVLETVSVLSAVAKGSWFTTDLAIALTAALLDIWPKNMKDPIFLSLLNDILISTVSSKTSGVYEATVKHALPRLTAAIGSSEANEPWVASSALDLAGSLSRGAPEIGLGDGFFATIAPTLDRDVLQNGVLFLTLVVRKDVGQLLSWTHTDGQTGLVHVLTVIARLLQNQDESGGLVIGDLIIHLFRRAGESVLPVLPDLLQAMLVRMQTAQTATFLQSLIIPFTFLVYNHCDAVFDLLESTRVGEDGRSGLDVMLNTWCENAATFQGFWPTRISALALCTLLRAGRPSLQTVEVKGDIIITAATKDTIMTRSKTRVAPPQFTRVPFPVKALKLLLHELQTNGEVATLAAPTAPIDAESDDGDSDWSDEEKVKDDRVAFLSDVIGVGGVSFDEDDVLANNDDEDLQKDPVSQIDLRAHVTSFIRESAGRDADGFGALVGQLSAEEMIVVQRALQEQG
ncbi:ARM repeat-containing protein [Russula earlei]|uniref:ARM repeat-containing protein n=1 Tax=Russula earlei TaxID=71964 RepID=A0ACC0UHG1_9AGAM|nr:ARM repeat-containing protein [Russula earlei]